MSLASEHTHASNAHGVRPGGGLWKEIPLDPELNQSAEAEVRHGTEAGTRYDYRRRPFELAPMPVKVRGSVLGGVLRVQNNPGVWAFIQQGDEIHGRERCRKGRESQHQEPNPCNPPSRVMSKHYRRAQSTLRGSSDIKGCRVPSAFA